MAQTELADELVREYLLFRGFSSSLKTFDAEIKNDKAKGNRVDKIMDQIHALIANYDLMGLKEFWAFLDRRLFSRLEQMYASSIYKLEVSLFRLYVINAQQNTRKDKVNEFFEKLSAKETNSSDWKEWFVLPYTKSAEEHTLFAMYFTKQWQDTFFLSLHNFLSVIFSCMPKPVIMNQIESQKEIVRLREENARMRLLVSRQDKEDSEPPSSQRSAPSIDLMDDFFVISQNNEERVEDGPPTRIRSFIRNIALPSSPSASRKNVLKSNDGLNRTSTNHSTQDLLSSSPSDDQGAKVKESITRQKSSTALDIPSFSMAEYAVTNEPSDALPVGASGGEGAYILLNQEEFSEHRSSLTHCKFSSDSKTVASADVDGVIKIWSVHPSPVTIATTISKAMLLSLEWCSMHQQHLLLLGNKSGTVRLFDAKEKRTVKEVATESAYPRIVSLTCSPCGERFVSSGAGRLRAAAGGNLDSNAPRLGRLSLWDLNTMSIDVGPFLTMSPVAVNTSAFSQNGQLLVTGAVDGCIRVFDMHLAEACGAWQAHKGEVASVLISHDQKSCFSMGTDGKFCEWSLTGGQLVRELKVHSGACGPFVLNAAGGYRQVQTPKGALFAFDEDASHVITCHQTGGLIYQLQPFEAALQLKDHKVPVVCVDWAFDSSTCVTGAMDGKVKVISLLHQ
ncbi:hypothetical protein CAPTEDRAFT_162335 [Capitella teleta]|uniref:WD repeat-containing protein 91 n=1 Tax=Capitella teleta TaxID=283909 RepID=R7TNB9_CAPTE|nr:hypothetical protein CAPTEDRAFT_162335 [Capitella teleta]|eukprot:ELT95333.1 hypothetical protein CAPTEDRAFT_162335 [Capitella teleta]